MPAEPGRWLGFNWINLEDGEDEDANVLLPGAVPNIGEQVTLHLENRRVQGLVIAKEWDFYETDPPRRMTDEWICTVTLDDVTITKLKGD